MRVMSTLHVVEARRWQDICDDDTLAIRQGHVEYSVRVHP